jgi:type IV pilus assembly protein PilN
MIRINLLPFRAERKKENIRRQVSIFILSLTFVLLTLFYYNYSLSSDIKKLNEDIDATNADLKKYNELNKEIARIKKTLENLKKKMDVIETLEQNRHAPVRLLDTMTKMVVAKRMEFTRLEDKGQLVRIEGMAMDNKTVADFMVRLQGCGLFKSVNLKTLRRQEVQSNNLKYFQVICEKVPDQKPAQKSSSKKAKT